MPISTRRSVRPSMPSDCEVTVRSTHGSAGSSGSNVPPPLASWTAEHAGHQGQRDRRQGGQGRASGHAWSACGERSR